MEGLKDERGVTGKDGGVEGREGGDWEGWMG